jgi:SAM-dependent methyltransferase
VTSGIWSSEFHGSRLFLDLPPFRHVADRYRPASVLDVGCGRGAYIAAFQRWGAGRLLGVDGFAASDSLVCSPTLYRQHDLRQPLELGTTFDLVISTEVAEHVDEGYQEAFIDSVARHAAKVILFSAARPGQPGVGHVHLKPPEHWLGLFRDRGWVPHHFDTSAARSLATLTWFRRNLVVLVRAERESELSRHFEGSPAGEVEIGSPWIGQPPMVCEHPFLVPLPTIEGE